MGSGSNKLPGIPTVTDLLHLRLGGQLVIGTKPGATGRVIPSFLAGTSLEKGIAYARGKRIVHMAADTADPRVDLSVIILV